MKSIGERIRGKRQNLGYTLEKLANEIGVTPSTILKYENGSINIPSDKIEKISLVLNTTPAYLMGWEDNKDKMINEFFNTEMIDSPELIEEISQLPFLDLWNKESSMLSTNMESFLKNDLNRLRNLVDLKNLKDSSSLKASLQHLKAAKDFYLKYIKEKEKSQVPIKYKILDDDSLEELKEIKYRFFDNIVLPKNAYFVTYLKNEKSTYFLINPNKTSAKQLEKYVIEYKEKKYLKFLTKFKNEYIMMGINKNNEAESISKKDFKVLGTVISKDSD